MVPGLWIGPGASVGVKNNESEIPDTRDEGIATPTSWPRPRQKAREKAMEIGSRVTGKTCVACNRPGGKCEPAKENNFAGKVIALPGWLEKYNEDLPTPGDEIVNVEITHGPEDCKITRTTIRRGLLEYAD